MAALHTCVDAAQDCDAERLETRLAEVEASLASMYATLKRIPNAVILYLFPSSSALYSWVEESSRPAARRYL